MQTRTMALLGLICGAAAFGSAAVGQTILERQEAMFRRNVGSAEQQRAQFPPHRIAGNLYYVGSQSLASFLVATPAGHILINTNWEDGVVNLRASVEALGFDFEAIEIVLGSHAHADHMQGDALVKMLTGAAVMAMAEDVPLLERMRPGDKPHPIDRVLQDGDEVSLGGSTLVARRTPGHTPGCTTWTMTVEEDGASYEVVIVGSMGSNPGFQFVNNPTNPTIADQYKQGFAVLRSLSPDIPLASHPAMYNMVEKHARLGETPNPFIDPAGYLAELDAVEGLFLDVLAEQQRAAAAQAQAAQRFEARLAAAPRDTAMREQIAGRGSLEATLRGRELTIAGRFEGLKSDATRASLRMGPATAVRGPVVQALEFSGGRDGSIAGVVQLSEELRAGLEAGHLYVQIDSAGAPEGNLWGWLLAQPR